MHETENKEKLKCRICGSVNVIKHNLFKKLLDSNNNGYRLTIYNYSYIECKSCLNSVCTEETENRINELRKKLNKIINI